MEVLIMKLLKIIIVFLLAFVSIQGSAQAELSNIQTLACESILCLVIRRTAVGVQSGPELFLWNKGG